jgi:hypothetical protein
MKKHPVFLFLFLLIHPVLSAQDYRNIINDGSAFYSCTLNSPGFLSGIKASSKNSPGNGDTLFIAVNSIREHSGNTLLDTIGGIIGRKIFKINNGWFHFINESGDTLYLNADAALNDSWKFCNIAANGYLQATCGSIHTISILGTDEMVKEISFQAKDSTGQNIPHFYNGKSILLGKRYGLIKTFDFYHMPDITGVYSLEGRNNPAIGFQGLTWQDIYDFEIGDEFHYSGHIPTPYGVHVDDDHYKIIKKVLNKQLTSNEDTVKYTMEYCREDEIRGFSYDYTFTSDTIEESYPYSSSLTSSSINWFPEQFTGTDYRYYSTLYHIVPERPAYGHTGNIYYCCWMISPYYPSHISDDREYTKGLGQVHYKNYFGGIEPIYYTTEDLVYYQKGSEQWGTPVSASCSEMAPYFISHPDTIVLNYQEGSTDTLFITSNKNWFILEGNSWFDYSQWSGNGNGMVIIQSKTENNDMMDRWFTIRLFNPISDKFITIRQLAKTSGLEDKQQVMLTIVPNPVQTTSTIRLTGIPQDSGCHLILTDITGRPVFRDSFRSPAYQFDRGAFSPGVYFIKIFSDKEYPLVKQKIMID